MGAQVISEEAYESIKPVASTIQNDILPLLDTMQKRLHDVAAELNIKTFIESVDNGDQVIRDVIASGEELSEIFTKLTEQYEALQDM